MTPVRSATSEAIQQKGPVIKWLGRVPWADTERAMRAFTEARGPGTADEVWLCEHSPVYTQGLAGRAWHVLDAGGIPVVQSNRGGQVTYHGPGQVVAYALVDLRRLGLYVKEFVFRLEAATLAVLESYGVTGHRLAGAPGVYVRLDDPFGHAIAKAPVGGSAFDGFGKIAALGLKVSRHCTYHGLAFNVAMDLRPFDGINPCGHPGLTTIDLATLGVHSPWDEAAGRLGARLVSYLSP